MTRVRTRVSAGWLVCLSAGLILFGAGQALGQVTLRSDPAVLAAFRSVVAKPSQSTARILCDGKDAALGTIVAGDGWIITKASLLKGKIVVRLKNDSEHGARIVGVEDKHDLAMLKIETKGLTPIQWAAAKTAAVGNWMASPGLGERPVAIGVVSVAARKPAMRDMPGPPPRTNSGYLGIHLEERDDGPVIIRAVDPNTPASKAGLKRGDVVLTVQNTPVTDVDRLLRSIMNFNAGDVVKLKIKREGAEKVVAVTLGKRPPNRGEMQNQMGSQLSERRGGFPAILQHDTVIKPSDCGGPLVGLDGKAVGINIARAGRTESYAIPAENVQALLADLRSGKLAPKRSDTVVKVSNLQDSISKLKAEIARKEKVLQAAEDAANEDEALAANRQIKALKTRLAQAEATLARLQKDPTKK
jgi:serine protease Do